MLTLWAIPCTYIPVDNMGPKSLLPMIFTLTFFYGIHYSAQLLFKLEDGHKYGLIIKATGPIAAFCLNYWRDGANQDTLYGLLAMVNYDLLFMAQGAIDKIYSKELQKCYDECSKTILMPLNFMLFGLNLAMCSPTIYHNEGFLFYYPLYTPTWAQCLHSFGSFYYTYFLTWYMKLISNEKFNNKIYDVVVGGSMTAYITHYFWIVVCVNKIVLANKLDFTAGVFVTYVGTEICILLFHFFLEFITSLIKKKKKKGT